MQLTVLDGNRPSVFRREDGTVSFRPSEIGKCIRGLVASLLQHEPEPFDEESLRTMRQGSIHEPHIAYDAQQEFGGYIQRQIRLTLPLDDFGSLDGTCDGVWFVDEKEVNESLFEIKQLGPWFDKDIVFYNKRYSDVGQSPIVYGVEIKASDDSMFDEMSKNGPIQAYEWQVSCYWAMIEHTLGVTLQGILFCVGNRRNGRRHYQFIEKPFYTVEQIIERCRKVTFFAQVPMEAANSARCDKDDYGCKWWRFHHRDHSMDEHASAKVKGYEFDPRMSKIAVDYYNECAAAEHHTLRSEGVRKNIVAELRNRHKVSTPGFRMYHSSRTYVREEAIKFNFPELYAKYQKTSFDSEAFLNDHPDLREEYTYKGEPTLTIKPNKAELTQILAIQGKTMRPSKPKKVQNTTSADTSTSDLLAMAGLGLDDVDPLSDTEVKE